MSQNPNQIGEAVIKVRADTSGVIADLDAIKPAVDSKVQELTGKGRTFKPGATGGYELERPSTQTAETARATKAVEDATRNVTDATKEADTAGKSYGQTLRDQVHAQRDFIAGVRQQIGVLTSLVSAFAAVVGVIYLMYNAGRMLGEFLADSTRKMQELSDATDGANKSLDAMAATRTKIASEKLKARGYSDEAIAQITGAMNDAEKAVATAEERDSSLGARARRAVFGDEENKYVRLPNGGLRLARPGEEAIAVGSNGERVGSQTALANDALRGAGRQLEKTTEDPASVLIDEVRGLRAETQLNNDLMREQNARLSTGRK